MTKDRPFLAEPLRILGIPVTPPLYYLWRMPVAQVELMCADTSVTVYPRHKDGKPKGSRREFKDMDADEIGRIGKEWNERYGGGRHRISLKP